MTFHDTRALRGFSQPLGDGGAYQLYGPPPWHFQGQTVSVFLRCDPDWIKKWVPAPLMPVDPPIIRLSSHLIFNTKGFGRDWACRNPNLSQFHEAVVACGVEYEGVPGHYDPLCWTDRDSEVCVARELYGWPHRLGSISQTLKPPVSGWQKGDVAAAVVARHNRTAFEMSVLYEKDGDLPAADMDAAHPYYYTCRALSRAWDDTTQDIEVIVTEMQEISAHEHWHGSAEVEFHAPELEGLKDAEVLGGRWNTHAFTKPFGRLLEKREEKF